MVLKMVGKNILGCPWIGKHCFFSKSGYFYCNRICFSTLIQT
nr:MAG TPA: hypothetical protein [Caudoviricetes sp.]